MLPMPSDSEAGIETWRQRVDKVLLEQGPQWILWAQEVKWWPKKCCPLSPEYQRERPIQLGGTAFSMIINDVSFYMLAPRRASPAFSSCSTCSCEMEEQWDHLKIILHQRSKSDVLSQIWHQERTTTEPGGAGAFHRVARAAGASMRLVKLFSPNTVSLNRISTFLKPRLGG